MAARALLDAEEMTPATAAVFRGYLDRLQVAPHYERALLGEHAMGLDCCRVVRAGELTFTEWTRDEVEGHPDRLKVRLLAGLLGPYWKLEECNYLRYMRQAIATGEQPYRLAVGQPDPDRLLGRGFGHLMATAMAPVLSRVCSNRDQALAELDVLRTGLDLKLYKRATGAYPATLAALAPGRARDVFTDRDFRYERRGRGFRLYSVGRNLRDDKGAGLQYKPAGVPGGDTDDIAWECVR